MALSDKERAIVEYGKAQGKSQDEVMQALTSFRTQQAAPVTPTVTTPPTPDNSAGADLRAGLNNAFGAINRGVDRDQEIEAQGRTGVGQAVGKFASGVRAAGEVLGELGAGAARALPGGTTAMNAVEAVATKAGEKVAPYIAPAIIGAANKVPEGAKRPLWDVGNLALGGIGIAGSVTPGGPAIKGTLKAGEKAVEAGKAVVDTVGAVTNSPVVKGALDTGIEYAERVPRFVTRRQEDLRTAATRAERIRTSPDHIANALKVGVDERIINTVEQADEPTIQGYAEIVKLAEESISTTGTIKQTARPEIVAGEAAAAQYRLIDNQRKAVGKAIGEATQNLSRDTTIDMNPSYEMLDEQMELLGVKLIKTEDGTTLDFGGTGFTKEQRTKMNELYELSTEGGANLTPYQVHQKDRMFSQLQREARMDKVGDIQVDTPNGKMSLFQVFRDVYSNTLEEVAPEIRPLNRQYRNLSTFTEDMEKTIIGTQKFETNKTIDPSEFAQTSLRRLFSEAQSAADFRGIADEMDNASRALGYTGARPDDLAQFAYEIRKIYPDATPRTGFEGSIRASTGVGTVVDTVLNAGKADLVDQQRALRELFDTIVTAPPQIE
jgi:hypothetical protein